MGEPLGPTLGLGTGDPVGPTVALAAADGDACGVADGPGLVLAVTEALGDGLALRAALGLADVTADADGVGLGRGVPIDGSTRVPQPTMARPSTTQTATGARIGFTSADQG